MSHFSSEEHLTLCILEVVIPISLPQDVEAVCRVLFYTAVLGCLDNEASLYVKMMLAKNKFVLGSDLPSVPQKCRHALLKEIFRVLVPVMKVRNHEVLYAGLSHIAVLWRHFYYWFITFSDINSKDNYSFYPPLQHETLGICMRGPMFPEVLSSLLQLCFGPSEVKNFPEDTAFFRDQMESVFMCMDVNHAIKQILLLKGLAQVSNGGFSAFYI